MSDKLTAVALILESETAAANAELPTPGRTAMQRFVARLNEATTASQKDGTLAPTFDLRSVRNFLEPHGYD